jgi:hypothetical protein
MAEVGIRTPGRGFGPYNGLANFLCPSPKCYTARMHLKSATSKKVKLQPRYSGDRNVTVVPWVGNHRMEFSVCTAISCTMFVISEPTVCGQAELLVRFGHSRALL